MLIPAVASGPIFAYTAPNKVVLRTTALWLVVAGIGLYSWRDWYRGVCGLVLLMAVFQHPDMPKSLFGIAGLNPWNLLLANVLLAWVATRERDGAKWDLPNSTTVWLLLYFGVVAVGVVRIVGDTDALDAYYDGDLTEYVNDYLINAVKWVIPGILLYDGCRTERRFREALFSILALYVLLGLQVAKWMPPQYALDADLLAYRSLRVLATDMGFHRVNLSAMFAGASWAILSTRVVVSIKRRWMIGLTALFMIYAQLMTGGRAGYVACIAIGLIFATLKWRRYLVTLPVALVVVAMFMPGVIGRATKGFSAETQDTNQRLLKAGKQDKNGDVDAYTVTAGRSVAWPYVIEKIRERPIIGYGREAMLRAGITAYLRDTYGEGFPHPHNMYLELLLDSGVVGFLIVVPFYLVMLWYSIVLLRNKVSPTCAAAGGVAAAFTLGLLFSGMGSQSFYPSEGWVGMWCAMFVMLRVRTEYKKRQTEATASAVGATAVAAGSADEQPAERGRLVASGRYARASAAVPVRRGWAPRRQAAGIPTPPDHASSRTTSRPSASMDRDEPAPRPFARPAKHLGRAEAAPAPVSDALVWATV